MLANASTEKTDKKKSPPAETRGLKGEDSYDAFGGTISGAD